MLKAFVFKPLSAFGSVPTLNAIFGAICWGIRWLYSEDRLLQMLEEFKESPPFVFSNPLPYYDGQWTFPKPIHVFKFIPNSPEEYRRYKAYKKAKWVSWEEFKKVLQEEPKELYNSHTKEFFTSEILPHAQINRLTMTTVGGELFNQEIYWLSTFGVIFRFFKEDYYGLVNFSLKFSQLGAEKSVGMGRFELEEVEPPKGMEEFLGQKTDRLFLISDSFYDEDFEVKESYYELKVQKSAVENYFGRITRSIWKKPLLYITAGSQIKVKQKKDHYGSVKLALKEGKREIYQYGIGFPLFARW